MLSLTGLALLVSTTIREHPHSTQEIDTVEHVVHSADGGSSFLMIDGLVRSG